MGLPVRSKEATLLVDLLIWSANEEASLLRQVGGRQLSKPKGILMGGITMVHNPSAVREVARDLDVTVQDSALLLQRMKHASQTLARQYGFEKIAELAARKRD
jgi:hypothetical protein